MQRMSVTALIAEDHAIALPLLDNQGIGIWKRLSVNRPAIKPHPLARYFLKHKIKFSVRFRRDLSLAEYSVVPRLFGRRNPLRLAPLSALFHAPPHALFF